MRAQLLVAGAAACFALSASAFAQSPAGTIRASLNSDIRSTNPGVNRDGNTDSVMMHVVEGLTAFREDGSVGLALAEKYEVSEDGKTYTFTLRPNVKFHNGAALTANDVVWSWKRWIDPATNWRCQLEFDGRGGAKLLTVEAKDPRTAVFQFEQPSALILAQMSRSDCGMSAILHKDSVDGEGKWKAPVATGPFKLGDWRKSEYVELVRFADYASRPEPRDGYAGGKNVKVDKVRFVIIPDNSAAKAALLSGSLDVMTDVQVADVAELKKRSDIVVEASPTMGITAILFQTNDPILKDARIRQAIAYSIDTSDIVAEMYQHMAQPNNSPVPVTSPFYNANQKKPLKRDLERAKKLLAEAGYKGQPIKMIANKRYPLTFDVAVFVQAMAQQAGINIELEVLDWATQLDKYTKGDYQSMSFVYSARLDPSLNFEMMTGPKASQPRKVWDNPDAQKILQQSMLIADPAKRQPLFDELYYRWTADMPAIVLSNGVEVVAMRNNVKGFKAFPMGMPRFWDVTMN